MMLRRMCLVTVTLLLGFAPFDAFAQKDFGDRSPRQPRMNGNGDDFEGGLNEGRKGDRGMMGGDFDMRGGPGMGPGGPGMMPSFMRKCEKFMRAAQEGDESAEEKFQQCIDEGRLQQMKKDMGRMVSGISMMKREVTKDNKLLKKCGVSFPQELVDALKNSDPLVARFKSAKSADELEEAMSEMMELGSLMQEWGPKMGMFHGLCSMLLNADGMIKRAETTLKGFEKKKNKEEIAELLEKFRSSIGTLKEALKKVKEGIKEDPEAAAETMKEEFFGEFDALNNIEQQIRAVGDVGKGLKQGRAEYKKFKARIAVLKKKNDVADLEAQLEEFKTAMDDVEKFLKAKNFDELSSAIETAFAARGAIMEGLETLSGGENEFTPKFNFNKGPRLDIPQSFLGSGGRQKPAEDENGGDEGEE